MKKIKNCYPPFSYWSWNSERDSVTNAPYTEGPHCLGVRTLKKSELLTCVILIIHAFRIIITWFQLFLKQRCIKNPNSKTKNHFQSDAQQQQYSFKKGLQEPKTSQLCVLFLVRQAQRTRHKLTTLDICFMLKFSKSF